MIPFEAVREEYSALWMSMVLTPALAKAVDYGAAKILAGRTQYEAVSEKTGVPWCVIGLIHLMEAGCRFGCHLHNGDPLSAKTVQVPKGRPLVGRGPFSWQDSAIDALQYDKLDKVSGWSVERIAYCLEGYNGWGYRKYHPEVHNPYLWSGSTHYVKGKYVKDAEWSADIVSAQVGAMPVLRRLSAMAPEIGFGLSPQIQRLAPQPAPDMAATLTTPESYPKAQPTPVADALGKSRTVLGLLFVCFGKLVDSVGGLVEGSTQVALDAVQHVAKLDPIKSLLPGSKWIGSGLLMAGVALALYARIDAARKGKIG